MPSEQRESIRCLPKKNAFASLGSGMTMVGQINDISHGGLAFEHLVDLNFEKSIFNEVDVFLGGRDFYLSDLACMKVYDIPITTGEENDSQFIKKRCGVKFSFLTDKQREQLEFFLANHTIRLSA
ncbi:MAG: hypothetical protein WCQ99_08615 [Pseudomonadota bacterium]